MDAEDRLRWTHEAVKLLRGKFLGTVQCFEVRPESSDSPGIRSTKKTGF